MAKAVGTLVKPNLSVTYLPVAPSHRLSPSSFLLLLFFTHFRGFWQQTANPLFLPVTAPDERSFATSNLLNKDRSSSRETNRDPRARKKNRHTQSPPTLQLVERKAMAAPKFSVGVDADPMMVEQTLDKTLEEIIKERRKEIKGEPSDGGLALHHAHEVDRSQH